MTNHRLEPHKNARLTPQGRLLMVQRIEQHRWNVSRYRGTVKRNYFRSDAAFANLGIY